MKREKCSLLSFLFSLVRRRKPQPVQAVQRARRIVTGEAGIWFGKTFFAIPRWRNSLARFGSGFPRSFSKPNPCLPLAAFVQGTLRCLPWLEFWESLCGFIISSFVITCRMTLELFFKENPVVALGFSGGVDSSYLLYAGQKYGAKIKGYYVKTAFQPEFEQQDVYKLAKQLGAEITVLEIDVLNNAQIVTNPPDRCYFCKAVIFGTLQKEALNNGIPLVIDGTNASDDMSDRPGMKALAELFVRSPLKECGISKDEVRRLSREAGLFTWDKPAYACLATRIPANRPITKGLLQRVEAAEDALFQLGFTDFRARVLDEAARLQFPQGQMYDAIKKRADIVTAIKPYFSTILLDLEGR